MSTAYAVKFAGRIAEANAEIARLAYEAVLSQKEKIHAWNGCQHVFMRKPTHFSESLWPHHCANRIRMIRIQYLPR